MAKNNLIYDVEDKPSWGRTIVFALQQLLAIMAATIAVPMIVGNGMSTSAALFGAGVGTIVYLLFTKSKSPVFLGSSFAFLGSMFAAFGGAGVFFYGTEYLNYRVVRLLIMADVSVNDDLSDANSVIVVKTLCNFGDYHFFDVAFRQ